MSKRSNEINMVVGVVTEYTVRRAIKVMKESDEDATDRAWASKVLIEYDQGKLKTRVRRYVAKNPLTLAKPSVIVNEVIWQICSELINETIGNMNIPKGIEDGDMWLTPGGDIQRMLMERQSEDMVMVIMAQRQDDGSLEPSFFCTENEEIIAEAQRGHRKYMELLAKEGR